MNKPKPFCLHFKLRSDNRSSYRPINLRVRVAGEKYHTAISTGVYVEKGMWQSYKRQQHRSGFHRSDTVEAKLDAVWDKIHQIYAHQIEQANREGWRVTGRTIVRQFQGKPPIIHIGPIAPCPARWMAITSFIGQKGRAYV